MPRSEIATVLRISEDAVRKRWERACATLASVLGRPLPPLPPNGADKPEL
jgi:DNA-directed RNA polymerase specialized sigma24 family protein